MRCGLRTARLVYKALLYEEEEERRPYDMTNMKIAAIIILSSSTEILFEIKTRCIFTPL